MKNMYSLYSSKILILRVFVYAIVLLPVIAEAQQNPVKLDSVTEARIASLEKKVSYNKPGQSHLLVVGLTTFGYVSSRTETTTGGVTQVSKAGGFGNGDTYEFSPMFLWRQGKKVLLEFEPSFNNDGVGVNWAAISYFLKPNLIIRGGYFVLPFGIYSKKLAAGWINKVATDPIGLPTGQDYGFGISGGLHLHNMKWNYDLSVTNGLQLMADGTLSSVNLGANARNKTFTGRLGLLPFSDNSLEIGVSGMTGGVDNAQNLYGNARANLYAFDFNYVKNYFPFQVNVKSQYNVVDVVNLDPATFAYNNHSTSGYGQFSLRPVSAENQFIKNLELAFRYGTYQTPANYTWGSNTTQIDYGLNYWINWRTVLRVTYEIIDSKSTSDAFTTDGYKTNALHFQFSIQL
jgi:hypothetical protein